MPGTIRILLRIVTPEATSYDANVPNKTIYVSDSDQSLFRRAQELAGGNLSAAIAAALRRYVDVEEGKREGFGDVVVKVGAGSGRKVRFVGVLLAQHAITASGNEQHYRVYGSRSGKFVVHVERAPSFSMVNAEGKPAGWRGHLGIGGVTYTETSGGRTLEVVETLDELRDKIPAELFEMVARISRQPIVEDLDI